MCLQWKYMGFLTTCWTATFHWQTQACCLLDSMNIKILYCVQKMYFSCEPPRPRLSCYLPHMMSLGIPAKICPGCTVIPPHILNHFPSTSHKVAPRRILYSSHLLSLQTSKLQATDNAWPLPPIPLLTFDFVQVIVRFSWRRRCFQIDGRFACKAAS